MGINYDYGKEIVKKYNELGEKGVINLKRRQRKHTAGKKSLLTELQLKQLARELEFRPADSGIWTEAKVARWIEKETLRRKSLESKRMGLLKKAI